MRMCAYVCMYKWGWGNKGVQRWRRADKTTQREEVGGEDDDPEKCDERSVKKTI